jgi:hypothetical protein
MYRLVPSYRLATLVLTTLLAQTSPALAQQTPAKSATPGAIERPDAPAATEDGTAGLSSAAAWPSAPAQQAELSIPTSYLLTGLKDDVKRLPSRFTALTVGAGTAVALSVRPYDHELSGLDHGSSREVAFFRAGQAAGCGWAQYGGAAATFAIGKLVGSYEAQVIGADLVRAQLLTAGIVYGIKGAVQRQRPDGGAYSFPSGHAATTFATATVLWNRLGWKVGLPAYLFAGYVATSRVPDQRHYASDVAFGSGIGLAVGQAVSGGDRKRFAVAPLLGPRTAGVQFAAAW